MTTDHQISVDTAAAALGTLVQFDPELLDQTRKTWEDQLNQFEDPASRAIATRSYKYWLDKAEADMTSEGNSFLAMVCDFGDDGELQGSGPANAIVEIVHSPHGPSMLKVLDIRLEPGLDIEQSDVVDTAVYRRASVVIAFCIATTIQLMQQQGIEATIYKLYCRTDVLRGLVSTVGPIVAGFMKSPNPVDTRMEGHWLVVQL